MRKITLLILNLGLFLNISLSQNPGLLISEFLQNPSGTDSPFEYVEFIATANIDFSVTPYTIIACNNGTATTDGWIEGNAITYAFEITSGTVSIGDIVYVGGTSMTPTGVQLRVIDTGINGGDGALGNPNSGGVFGNGGASSDGIAVFNLPVAMITSTTVPTDAVFYGSGPDHGTAVVSAGADGYELPNNDLYSGGKLQQSSFLAPDIDLTVATGVFNLGTNSFVTARTFYGGSATDGTSEITFGTGTPPSLSLSTTNITFDENDGTILLPISIANSNTTSSSVDISIIASGTATENIDFILNTSTITFPASSTGSLDISIDISDDAIAEENEYIIIQLTNNVNADLSGNTFIFVYINDNDRTIPTPSNELKFELLTSFSNGAEGSNSSEIVAFDSSTDKLFIANSIANNLDIVDFSNPSLPVLLTSINLDSVGYVNSVAVFDGTVAVALQDLDAQNNGYISFFDHTGVWLKRLTVGAMPDMLTFNKSGNLLVVACEGEPSDDYTNDPEGSVAIIEMVYPANNLTIADVTILDFNDYDGNEAALISQGIRIYGPGASASMDFEPEYVAISETENEAYVTLQENNAVAVINLDNFTIDTLYALGTIDHNVMGYGMDVSNVTNGINIANFPVHGMFLPDAIATITINGNTYYLTANEGDARAWSGFNEETRVKDEILDPTNFPDGIYFNDQYLLGRLLITNTLGDDLNDGDFEELYSLGTRSFTIWDATTGQLVYDSGDLFELILASDPTFSQMFNASNSAGGISVKNRSDDKGPEVEGITTAVIESSYFAFVSLERIGGVFIFNINNPMQPVYVGYANNRTLISNGPDRGAEGIIFISSNDSPNGNSLLLLANEISSTVSVYQLNDCNTLTSIDVITENGETTFCENDSLVISSINSNISTFEWTVNGTTINQTYQDSIFAFVTGNYQLSYTNSAESCWGISDTVYVETLPLPTPNIYVTNAVLSTDLFSTYQWYFEGAILTGETNQDYTPTQDGLYTVVVTNADGCEGSEDYDVNFTQLNVESLNQITIYPNPANSIISIAGLSEQTSFVEIYSAEGKLVLAYQVAQNDSLVQIDISELEKGFYTVTLVENQAKRVFKLVVE